MLYTAIATRLLPPRPCCCCCCQRSSLWYRCEATHHIAVGLVRLHPCGVQLVPCPVRNHARPVVGCVHQLPAMEGVLEKLPQRPCTQVTACQGQGRRVFRPVATPSSPFCSCCFAGLLRGRTALCEGDILTCGSAPATVVARPGPGGVGRAIRACLEGVAGCVCHDVLQERMVLS
jgi:hypothetical protein